MTAAEPQCCAPSDVPGWVRLAVLRQLEAVDQADLLAVLYCRHDPGELSPNQRLHWAERHRRAQDAHTAAMFAHRWAGDPRFTDPVSVTPLLVRQRALDPDNALAGCKALADGFTRLGLWPDDGPRWVEWRPVVQVTGRAFRPGWVCLIVRRRAG